MISITIIQSLLHLMGAVTDCQSVTATGGTGCDAGLPTVAAGPATISSVLQIVFGIIAVLAVLMIVIAGMRFVTGQANPQEISKARGTIIYALIGLLIALAAEALVTFVVGKL